MRLDKSATIELQCFGTLQYFKTLHCFDNMQIEQFENYQKGSYRNRFYIGSTQGLKLLSIPLIKGKHEHVPIKEVRIANEENWRLRHLRSIQTSYGKAPFFDYIMDFIAPIYEADHDRLFDFNLAGLSAVYQFLKLGDPPTLTNEYLSKAELSGEDLRNKITPKSRTDSPTFSEREIIYPQLFEHAHPFIPNLSILDALFCIGPATRLIIQKEVGSLP